MLVTMRRFVLVFALMALAVALWTATAHAQPGRAPAPPPGPDKITGMNADLLGESLATQQAQLANMKASLHITMVRVDLDWEYVQYDGSTSYDWSLYDQLLGAIKAEGMTPLVIIQGTASWASTSGSIVAQPDPVQFATFVTAVVDRYGAQDYEIWNEPNNTAFWATPNAAVYTTLLQDSYQAIKAVAPSSTVISGGLAPETTSNGNIAPVDVPPGDVRRRGRAVHERRGLSPLQLPRAARHGRELVGLVADVGHIAFHPLGHGQPTGTRASRSGSPRSAIRRTRRPSPGSTARRDRLTRSAQVNAFAVANSWVGPVFWYAYQDDTSGPFGLLTASGLHKTAYTTMAGL